MIHMWLMLGYFLLNMAGQCFMVRDVWQRLTGSCVGSDLLILIDLWMGKANQHYQDDSQLTQL